MAGLLVFTLLCPNVLSTVTVRHEPQKASFEVPRSASQVMHAFRCQLHTGFVQLQFEYQILGQENSKCAGVWTVSVESEYTVTRLDFFPLRFAVGTAAALALPTQLRHRHRCKRPKKNIALHGRVLHTSPPTAR